MGAASHRTNVRGGQFGQGIAGLVRRRATHQRQVVRTARPPARGVRRRFILIVPGLVLEHCRDLRLDDGTQPGEVVVVSGLVPPVRRVDDPAAMRALGVAQPFHEIAFDVALQADHAVAPRSDHARPRMAA